MRQRSVRVQLSGGIGTGKSAVGTALQARGALVIDADRVGHAVLDPDGEAYAPVANRWPDVVIGGVIDRRALGRIVFSDPSELAALEAMTHPEIRGRIEKMVDNSAAWLAVVEVPFKRRFLDDSWRLVIVDAPDEVRYRRLLTRGMGADEIDQRMASQPRRSEWLDAADYVIDNSDGWSGLESEVDRFLEWLTTGCDD